jgi:protoporphyrinogen oxidase
VSDLTILGGGPAGLALALYARRAGFSFDLFERSQHLGGMCRTLRCGEHLYDCGAHRFHDRDPEITRDLVELLGEDLLRVEAPSKIWDRGRFIDFPPTPLNAVLSCGVLQAGRISLELLRSLRRRSEAPANFEEFAVSRFGETLSRRILLDYSEKLWGLPASELSPDIATRRLHGMTLRSLLYELIFPAMKTEHIDGSFLYPRRGYGEIAERLASKVPPQSVHCGSEVAALECDRNAIARIRFANGESIEPDDRVVSTLPLTLLVELLGEAVSADARHAVSRLRFRHIRLVFVRLKMPRVSPNASIYIPDARYCISRVYEPKNRSAAMAPAEETSLVAEVPCSGGDSVVRLSEDQIVDRVLSELVELRLVKRAEVIEWRHHFLLNAYPVYTIDYAEKVRVIVDALATLSNLETIGRAGRFVYSHMHDQLRFAKDYIAQLSGSRAQSHSPALRAAGGAL